MIDDSRLDDIARAVLLRENQDAMLVTGLMLAEEAGEAVQRLRRYLGRARRSATAADAGAELADIAIATAVLARLLNVDLAGHIEAKLAEGTR
jgi:NTP pyrophosphatase (non-canonical NTP hydrolase)